MAIGELEEFERVHGILLASAGLPPSLNAQLLSKMKGEVFDGGSFFQIEELGDEERQRKLVLREHEMRKESQVFLVDHAWSFRLPDARKQLETIPGLAERMASLMSVKDPDAVEESIREGSGRTPVKVTAETVVGNAMTKAQERGEDVLWLEFDGLHIDDAELQSLNLSTRFPKLVGLSLWGNNLSSLDVLLTSVSGLQALHALWLNETPLVKKRGNAVEEAIMQALPHLELYNSRVTNNYSEWAIGFCADIFGSDESLVGNSSGVSLNRITEMDLSDRGLRSLKPQVFNVTKLPYLADLNLRGNTLKDDSEANLWQALQALVSLQSLQVDIPGPLGSSASRIVEKLPKLHTLNERDTALILEQDTVIVDNDLRPRLPTWTLGEPLVDRIMRAMWSHIMMYRLSDEEKLDETPIWYVMDELGSALRHSDVPNFKVAPFMYLPDGTIDSAVSYTLLWPIRDVTPYEECTRDYVGVGEDKQRSARLTAWFHTPELYFLEAFRANQTKLEKVASEKTPEKLEVPTSSCLPDNGKQLTVYSDIPFVLDFLRRPEFTLVVDPAKADIIWIGEQIDDDFIKAAGIRPDQYINQFPFESCLVMKHHLARTVQKAFGNPAWLQPTYDMETQLYPLIGDYIDRESRNQNNLWIVKPWNMARTIDTTVTSSLQTLVRLVETGPKIGQKYIEKPALFRGRKFDLRYIVLLRSLCPLEVYLCEVFWVRISNNQYTTEESSLAEFETHFTVMNYRGGLQHTGVDDFVPEFEREHHVKWIDIHEKVKGMVRKVFEGAAQVHPEMHSPRSRAIYGVDVMLDMNFEPKLLEVTYCPDCIRACKYDIKNVVGNGNTILGKEFVDCVFGTLFLNVERDVQRL